MCRWTRRRARARSRRPYLSPTSTRSKVATTSCGLEDVPVRETDPLAERERVREAAVGRHGERHGQIRHHRQTGGTPGSPIRHEAVVRRCEHGGGDEVAAVGIDLHRPLRHEPKRPSSMHGGRRLDADPQPALGPRQGPGFVPDLVGVGDPRRRRVDPEDGAVTSARDPDAVAGGRERDRPSPTRSVVADPVAGSIVVTVPSSAFATHSDPNADAIAAGPRPTGSSPSPRRPRRPG